MYKTYLFLEGELGSDPFSLAGQEAQEAVRGAVAGIAGYTQTRTQADQVDDSAPPPFTGVVELWFGRSADALDSVSHAKAIEPLLFRHKFVVLAYLNDEEENSHNHSDVCEYSNRLAEVDLLHFVLGFV